MTKNAPQVLGYQKQNSVIDGLNSTAKLIILLAGSLAAMVTYDTRFLVVVGLLSLACFPLAKLKWSQYSFVASFIIAFAVLNLVLVFLFAPQYGVGLYHSKHVLVSAGYFTVTSEELFYLLNVALKYCCTVPLALLFLLTTNPSYFAASLNRIGVSYKVSYAVALALRYIPDIQADYRQISNSQQARGVELSKKAKLPDRVKGVMAIILPLIFTSLDRIETIATAMELRRFGRYKQRTWYSSQPFAAKDWLVVLIAVLLVVAVGLLWHVNGGRFYNPFA